MLAIRHTSGRKPILVRVKLVVGWKRETVLAHIVGGVHFEGARIGFLFKYNQKTKKDKPEKMK